MYHSRSSKSRSFHQMEILMPGEEDNETYVVVEEEVGNDLQYYERFHDHYDSDNELVTLE